MDRMDNRVDEVIRARGLSYAEVGRKMSPPVDRQQIMRVAQGKRKMTDAWLHRFAASLRVPVEELVVRGETHIGNTPDQPEVIDVTEPSDATDAIRSVINRPGMGAGDFGLDDALGPPILMPRSVIRGELRARPEHLLVFRVEGSSMTPVLESNDLVIVDQRQQNVGQGAVFVLWDGDYLVCKWVEFIRNGDPPRVRIKSENPRFETYDVALDPDQGARIIGRAVWVGRRL